MTRRVEPIPETRRALARLSPGAPADLAAELQAQVSQAREVVPELVGVSLASTAEGLTFTFVASSDLIATLDGLQYLDGGPCVEAVRQGESLEVPDAAPLDENQWELFSRAESAAGVEATLSLPVLTGDRVTGGVNLYASRAGAFRGRQDQLADIFGAWAAGAVTNADLSFRTRLEAVKTPARLEALDDIAKAVGVVAATQGVSTAEARTRLEHAGALAGITPENLARAVLTNLQQ
jgi:GAF domain-containing protein